MAKEAQRKYPDVTRQSQPRPSLEAKTCFELDEECPLNPETALKQALGRSSGIQEQIDTLVNDPGLFIPDLPTNQRTQIASALFSLTIKQAWSVTFLFQKGHYEAGLALTRSVLEVFCRGRWIKYHAKKKAVKAFSSNKFPEMSYLIKKTMSRVLDPDGEADDFFSTVHRCLSDYVHGGVHMFEMQLSETGIASEFNLEELREVLMISDVMQLLAASELLDFTRCINDDDCQTLKKEHTQCQRFQADLGRINDLLQHIA